MMKIIKNISEMRIEAVKLRKNKKSVGFVPTMGALHEGHISLVRRSKKTADRTVVSIFVNPIQFSPSEDLSKYPKPIKNDIKILEREGVEALFMPSSDEMYRERETSVLNNASSHILCGKTRKNHFEGVLTVVAKLFNIVAPDFSFFGEKDYQQLMLIRKMADDLNFNIKIIGCPIVRESDGLALSSRNAYLTPEERRESPVIYNTLLLAGKLFKESVSISEIERISKKTIEKNSKGKTDYVKIYGNNLEECDLRSRRCRIFAAVRFKSARLIDNMEVRR